MSDTHVGKLVGERFEISSQIGEGGMGVVFFAEDKATGGKAAVKFLHRHLLENDEFIARFRQEARTASQFRHEGAVRILDSGDSEDGVPYIAMDFCAGQSLRAVIDQGAPLSTQKACRIAEKVLRALGEAHDSGIIHRDLKPDNIKVETDADGVDRIKVLDFGVAKFIGTEDMNEMSGAVKTATGVVFGTPKYMAPEQIRGEGVDAGSDIYSVGAILYEMLSGKPTFDADDMMEFVTKYLNQPVPDIGVRAGDIDIPVAVRKLVMQMLDKERSKRPSKAGEIADALEKFAKVEDKIEGVGVKRLRMGHFVYLIGAVLGAAGVIAAALLPDNIKYLSELSPKGVCSEFPLVPAGILVAAALGLGAFLAYVILPRVGELAFLVRTVIVVVLLAGAGGAIFLLSGKLLGSPADASFAKWSISFPLAAALAFVLFSLGWGWRRRLLSFLLGGVLGGVIAVLLLPLPLSGASGFGGIWELKSISLDVIRPSLVVLAVALTFALCGMLAPKALARLGK